MIDLAIISLPRLELTRPAIAPAILSSLANNINCTNKVYDFAIATYDRSTKKEWHEFELYWQIDLKYELARNLKLKLDSLFDEYVDEVLEQNPKFIAVSVFSHNSINATNLFLEKIRLKTSAKIIIGGQGIISRLDDKETYAETLLEKGLIDYFLSGEAETSFPAVLQGTTKGPGINNFAWQQLEKLDDTPIPNYQHYKLDRYHHLESGKSIWVNGSRGCVRRCDFCDIGKLWKKFRFRSGESLFNEVHAQMTDLKIDNFQFADALINGSLKSFVDLNTNLIHGIEKKIIKRPLYGGHFIVRPKHQMTEEHYRQAAMAGMDYISIGVETGSDALRWRMNKKFTNDDIENHLEMSRKYNVKNLFLMFVGHPTETLQDHLDTLEMLKRFRKYAVYGVISGLTVGHASIIDNTPLEHWAMENNVYYKRDGYRGDLKMWYNPNNPDLTVSERVRRQLEVYETAIDLNWPINHVSRNLNNMKATLLQAKQENFEYF